MAEVEQSSDDYFPLDEMPVHLQLAMYEYVDGWTANELRKVDRLRRQIVDSNPRVFEKKRLIPCFEVWEWSRNSSLLRFMGYCKFCLKLSSRVTFDFENRKCVKGFSTCSSCRLDHIFPNTWSILGSTFEECFKIITKGSKIETLAFGGVVSQEFLQCIGYLIDSSFHTILARNKHESVELFNNLVQETRRLTVTGCNSQLNDDFFRSIGSGTQALINDFGLDSRTNQRLAILVGRNDLTHIKLKKARYIDAEAVRNAIQILVQSSSPKDVTLKNLFLRTNALKMSETLELDAESTAVVQGDKPDSIHYSYTYGGGKVKVDLDVYAGRYYLIHNSHNSYTRHNVHIVSHKL